MSNRKPARTKTSPILRLISGSEPLIIKPTDGSLSLMEAKKWQDMFVYIGTFDTSLQPINNYLKDHSISIRSADETPVQVYELTEKATYCQMFGSLSSDLRNLLLTEHQIIEFYQSHSDWVRKTGWSTLFLAELFNHSFIIVRLYFSHQGALHAAVDRLGHPYPYGYSVPPWLVAPKLTA